MGYGQDSEMDAQDLINEIGRREDGIDMFIEGESDIIDEADEMNMSFQE